MAGGMDEVEQDKTPLASHCHSKMLDVLHPFRKWKQRAIQELTKKNFENIRQGGDGTELSQLSTSYDEFPILGTFDKKRKLLVPLWAQLELGANVEGKFELVNRSKEEGKADNGPLVGPKAVQKPLKEERVKTGKQDPSPD